MLYEMASGKRPFEGKSQAGLISAILEKDPEPLSALQPFTPPAFDHVVTSCLAKKPDDRFQAAHDVNLELKWIAEGASRLTAHAKHPASAIPAKILPLVITAVLAIMLALGVFIHFRTGPVPVQAVRASLLAPEGTSYVFSTTAGGPVLSPDGPQLVFPAKDFSGTNLLWLRKLDSETAQPLADTEGASAPFWSPDSRSIAFLCLASWSDLTSQAEARNSFALRRADVEAHWSPKGIIVFAPSVFSGLAPPVYPRVTYRRYKKWTPSGILPFAGDRKPVPFAQSQFNEKNAVFSPDGHWLAYQSDESGKVEVYLAHFPGPGGKRQVSLGGGAQPKWRRDGKALFFVAPQGKMTKAQIAEEGSTIEVGAPRELFQSHLPGDYTSWMDEYDVTADGKRFLILETPQNATPLTIITNWPAILSGK